MRDMTYQVVHVLPNNNGVLIQIGDVRTADALRVLLHDQPADVRIDESLPDRVRVLDGVCVAVVCAVALRPPSNRALSCSDSNCCQVDL